MNHVGTGILLVEHDDGTMGSVGLGAMIAGSKSRRTVTIRKSCTVVGLLFWPHGTNDPLPVAGIGGEHMQSGDTYTVSELEVDL